MHRRLLIFFLFFVTIQTVFSQTGWHDWVKIYSDESMVVELQLYYSDNSCEEDGRQFKYRTRLTGQFRNRPYFVNWKMNYFDCNGSLYYLQNAIELWDRNGGYVNGLIFESLDNRFTANSILQPFYDVNASRSRSTGSGYMPRTYSIKPDNIDNVYTGTATQLTVQGGYLGPEAEWCWYRDKCKGKAIGKGKTIRVSPEETTTYFVRAEGADWTTPCVQITLSVLPTVYVYAHPPLSVLARLFAHKTVHAPGISSDTMAIENIDSVISNEFSNSTAPIGIIAQRIVCIGDSALLKVSGGELGTGAAWIWYSNHRLLKIGTGESIYVKPQSKTLYRVRAEYKGDTTRSVSFEMSVLEKSLEHFKIVYSGKPMVCALEKVELEIDNFMPDDDGVWNWYSDSCSGAIIASGAFVEFHPGKTTTYYLRRDGTCNNSNCTSYMINVYQKSDIKNARIIIPDTVFEGEKTILSIRDGILGKDAQWNWYKDTCLPDKLLGTGDSITVEMRRPTRYFVKAVGFCSETPCIMIEIKPARSRRLTKLLEQIR
jgi:hypothetical protein